jgi:predicted MFS family arabinose efflux permease
MWVLIERRSRHPLVHLAVLRSSGILRANIAMFVSGIGMYLLFSVLARYVQTPPSADYGFGLSGALAGAALVPFSVLGFLAGRLTPWIADRLTANWTFIAYAITVMLVAGLFAVAPDSLSATLISMAVLGFGVGGVSAVMPRMLLADVPHTETSSVLSMNQIVRSIGFSIGSALAGFLLATATPSGTVPHEDGYRIAAICVLPLLAVSGAVLFRVRSRQV